MAPVASASLATAHSAQAIGGRSVVAWVAPAGAASAATKGGDDMADMHTGTCFCGAVEIEAAGAPIEMGYCHCESCRRYSGAPLSAYLLWRAEDVTVTKRRTSSAASTRQG